MFRTDAVLAVDTLQALTLRALPPRLAFTPERCVVGKPLHEAAIETSRRDDCAFRPSPSECTRGARTKVLTLLLQVSRLVA